MILTSEGPTTEELGKYIWKISVTSIHMWILQIEIVNVSDDYEEEKISKYENCYKKVNGDQ